MNLKRILVVDDDEGIVDVLSIVLKKQGYEVRVEQNGKKVMRGKMKPVPDLILLDVYVGSINGKDICRQLRNQPDTANTPVIVMSASFEPPEQILQCGATAFIEKPFDIHELLAMVKKIIRAN